MNFMLTISGFDVGILDCSQVVVQIASEALVWYLSATRKLMEHGLIVLIRKNA